MIEDIRKKKEKGTRKLEQFLEEKGYVIIEHDKKGKHDTITVKRAEELNDPNAQTVKTTLSHRVTRSGDAQSRMKMVLRDIENTFAGRKRRGQGEFKLSLDGPQKEEWFGVLKGKKMSQRSKDVIEMVMRDGQERSIIQIIEDASTYVKGHPVKHTLRDVPTNRELSSYFRGNPDYQNMGGSPTMYRRV